VCVCVYVSACAYRVSGFAGRAWRETTDMKLPESSEMIPVCDKCDKCTVMMWGGYG